MAATLTMDVVKTMYESNYHRLTGWRYTLSIFSQRKIARQIIGGKWERWWVESVNTNAWHPVKYFSNAIPESILGQPKRVALWLSGIDWRQIEHRPSPLCRGTPEREDWSDLGTLCRRYFRRRETVLPE